MLSVSQFAQLHDLSERTVRNYCKEGKLAGAVLVGKIYYRGLREWGNARGYLIDTCLAAQDEYKAMLDYFKDKILTAFIRSIFSSPPTLQPANP